MKRGAWLGIIVFSLLSVMAAGFIFYNAMQSGEVSNGRSREIAQQVQGILAPAETEKTDAKNAQEAKKTLETWNAKVRKAAHILEYAALGFCLGGLVACLFWETKRWYVGTALFLALLTGVTDEYIQAFFKRTSVVKDVWWDLSGALVGMAIAALVFAVGKRISKKRRLQHGFISE